MAYGDLSTFLPQADAGSGLDVERARAEGESRARYLSSMDQFYEQLEETSRQFDITQELAERQFEWMSGFEEKKLSQEERLAGRRLDIEEMLGTRQADLLAQQTESERRRMDLESTQAAWQRGFSEREFDFEREFRSGESAFLQDLYGEQQELEERRFVLEQDVLSQQYGLGGGSGGNTADLYGALGGTTNLGLPRSATGGRHMQASSIRRVLERQQNTGKSSYTRGSLSSGSSSGKAFTF